MQISLYLMEYKNSDIIKRDIINLWNGLITVNLHTVGIRWEPKFRKHNFRTVIKLKAFKFWTETDIFG